jgi:hypothetical protein
MVRGMKKELWFGFVAPGVVRGADRSKQGFPKIIATASAAFYNISVFSFCDYC